ncbi:MAG: hypothetical protein ACD_68C00093G0002, partial [uncultured bacterium]
RLKEKGKDDTLKLVQDISDIAKFVYVRQKEQLGDGHAILQAKDMVGDEPVAVLFGDDIVDSKIPCIKQMFRVYEKYQDPVIAVFEVPKEEVSYYGVIAGVETEDRVYQIKELVEKPPAGKAPSNLAIVGKYIITPEVFQALENADAGLTDGEIRLIDGFRALLKTRSIYGYKFAGTWYNCGNKLEYLKAVVNFGLRHEEVKEGFEKHLKEIAKKIS